MSRFLLLLLAIIGVALALLVANDESGRTLGLENDDFARLVTLSTFGLVIGAGLFTRGIPFGETTRNIALFLGLLAVLVAGYTFRYELQDAASQATGGFIAASPLSGVDAAGREAFSVERAPNGHFEARVAVDGTAITMVVDTGASSTVLSAADAGRVGIDIEALDYWVPVSTANGRTEAAQVDVKEMALGPIVRRDVKALVARPGVLEQSLLGMNFIGSLSGLDMRGGRLILRD